MGRKEHSEGALVAMMAESSDFLCHMVILRIHQNMDKHASMLLRECCCACCMSIEVTCSYRFEVALVQQPIRFYAMVRKVLLATDKAFAKEAVTKMEAVFKAAKYDLVQLENYKQRSELLAAAAECDAMIIRSDKASADLFDVAKNLKLIVRAGAGVDNIDLAAASAKGVVAMNTPGQNSNAVAELAFGMMGGQWVPSRQGHCNPTGL